MLLVSCTYAQLTFTITTPLPNFSITCANPVVPLFATSNYMGTVVVYAWTGPQMNSTVSNSLIASTPGIYTIAAMAGSLSASQTLAIGVNATAPTLSVTASGSVISCSTGSVLLQPSSSQSNVSYTWTGPSFLPLPIQPSNYLAYVPGTYTVEAKDNTNGCSTKKLVTITDDRNYPILANTGPFTISCPGGTVDLSAELSGSGSFSFQWFTPVGAITSATNSALLNTNMPGTYNVLVTNTQNGCISQKQIEVWACTAIHEKEQEHAGIKIYPNPVQTNLRFTISNDLKNAGSLLIRDQLGQLLYSDTSADLNKEINLEFLSPGIYYLSVKSEQTDKVFKIAKE